MSQPELAGGGALIQGGHELAVVLGHVDVELLERRQAVEIRGMRARQLLQVKVQLLVGHLE